MDPVSDLEGTPTCSDEQTPETTEGFSGVCSLSETTKLEHSRFGPVNRVTFSHVHHSNDSDEECYRGYVDSLCRHRHPNVVSVYGVDAHPSGACLYAEYPDRGDILTYMKKRNMTWGLLLDITQDILKGLVFLEKLRSHDEFIDIEVQPSNVWMFAPGTAKLAFCAFPRKPTQDESFSGLNLVTGYPHDALEKRIAHSVESFGSTLETLIKSTRAELTASCNSDPCPSILNHFMEMCTKVDRAIVTTFSELLDQFRSHHPLTCYTAWDISIHNTTVYKPERWVIHKRQVFKRKGSIPITKNAAKENALDEFASYVSATGIECSEGLDLKTWICDEDISDCCLGIDLIDNQVSKVVESPVNANDLHTTICERNSCCDLTEHNSSCYRTDIDLSAFKETFLRDSSEDIAACNGEDRSGSESYLWDELLPDNDSTSFDNGQMHNFSDESECVANSETCTNSVSYEKGVISDNLESDQLDSIDGFVPAGFPSNDLSEYEQNLNRKENNYHNKTYVRTKNVDESENRISGPSGFEGDSYCSDIGLSLLANTGVALSETNGKATSDLDNFFNKCQSNALLDDRSGNCSLEGVCSSEECTSVSRDDQREVITLGNNFVRIGTCAELSPLDVCADYRLDIILLLRDIDDKQSGLRQKSSLNDYWTFLLRCLTKIDSREFHHHQAIETTTHQDPNSRAFPVSAKIRLNPSTLRPWLKDWKPFDTSLPNSGFAWESVPICKESPMNPVEKVPWYGEWQPFDMTIDNEVGWETLPNDVIEEDQPTELQINVINSRQNRKHFHDDRAMCLRREDLTLYFKEKYNLKWEILNLYLNFVTRLDQNAKELERLAEDDFSFIIR